MIRMLIFHIFSFYQQYIFSVWGKDINQNYFHMIKYFVIRIYILDIYEQNDWNVLLKLVFMRYLK